LQHYILYIFIHAEQKCSVIEAAVGAEGKAVIHKNAPNLHCRTLQQLNYMQLVFFFNKKKSLQFAFNLLRLFFFPPFFLTLEFSDTIEMYQGSGIKILLDTKGWGLARGSFSGEGPGTHY
jgi:hypothetical protein